MENHYSVLGVFRPVDPEKIRAAYRQKARDTHADLNGKKSDDEFIAVRLAYETLQDEEKRNEYEDQYVSEAQSKGLFVCERCFCMVRVPKFRKGQKPKCPNCKTTIRVSPETRDAVLGEAFAIQMDGLMEAVGAEGAELAKDAVVAIVGRIRKKFGLVKKGE